MFSLLIIACILSTTIHSFKKNLIFLTKFFSIFASNLSADTIVVYLKEKNTGVPLNTLALDSQGMGESLRDRKDAKDPRFISVRPENYGVFSAGMPLSSRFLIIDG